MKKLSYRYAAVTVLGSLIAALALAQAGCSLGDPGYADEKDQTDASAAGSPSSQSAAPVRPVSQRRSSQSGQLKDPLLRSFDDALGGADDLKDSERNEARRILREADPILTKVKEENRKALERANRPPKIVRPKKQKEKAAKPQAKEEPKS